MLSTSPRMVLLLRLALISGIGSGGGCIHQDDITMRPDFAYPQHLTSLCRSESLLSVSNRGEFVSSDYTSRSDSLLLSAQLVGGEPQGHRLTDYLVLDVSLQEGITIRMIDSHGGQRMHHIPATRMHCSEAGELLLNYPSDSFYFWASVGTKSHELALWTNQQGDAIIHNRWRESHTGIVSGAVSGDAWARFEKATMDARLADRSAPAASAQVIPASRCSELSGDFQPTAEVIHADGSLDSRTAAAQFFREELIGKQPVNQEATIATRLHINHQPSTGISVDLFAGDDLLGSRELPFESLACVDGRWIFKGDKTLASAWLLLAASGGMQWEDLSLWRDSDGSLLVEGRYVTRSLLLLIPFGGTESIFMAFPLLSPPSDAGANHPG